MEPINIPYWVESLGYAGAFLGAILEGEALYLMAIHAARSGYLHVPSVVAAIFLGTLASDWGYFLLGRGQGQWVLNRSPHLNAKFDRMRRLFARWGPGLLLGYRFIYGFRIILPLLFGISRVPPRTFFLFSFLSTTLWTALFGVLGYYFAGWALDQVTRYAGLPGWVIPVAVSVGISLWMAGGKRNALPKGAETKDGGYPLFDGRS